MSAAKHGLHENDLKLYRDAFRLFDKDGNGAIDVNELRDIMKGLNEEMSCEDIERMINNIDFNKTGLVDFPEFVAVLSANKITHVQHNIQSVQRRNKTNKASIMNNFSLSSESNLKEAFEAMDLDGDGFISPTDLMKVMNIFEEDANPESSLDMIACIDNEGSGRVTFKDFCIM